MEKEQDKVLREVTESDYKYGFVTDIDADEIPKGLTHETIRLISKKKNEPDWMLEFRLKAFEKWLTMKMPNWAHLNIQKLIIKILFTIQHLNKNQNI